MKPTILGGDLRKKEHNNNVPGVLQCAYFHDIQLHPSNQQMTGWKFPTMNEDV